MIELGEDDFRSLCLDPRVAAAIAAFAGSRRAALGRFALCLILGIAFGVAGAFAMVSIGWTTLPPVVGALIFCGGVYLARRPLRRAGIAIKAPVLTALAARAGLTWRAAGFTPPGYADAHIALFGTRFQQQSFNDLFCGSDADGRAFAFYDARLTRSSGRSTATVFSGQIYTFQRRAPGDGELFILPERTITTIFRPVMRLPRATFPNDPEFAARFEVYGEDPAIADALLDDNVRRTLLALRGAGRVHVAIGRQEVVIAIHNNADGFEPGSIFRSALGEARARAMFDDVSASLFLVQSAQATFV